MFVIKCIVTLISTYLIIMMTIMTEIVLVVVIANVPETDANIINVRPCFVIFNIPSGSCAFSFDMSIFG